MFFTPFEKNRNLQYYSKNVIFLQLRKGDFVIPISSILVFG